MKGSNITRESVRQAFAEVVGGTQPDFEPELALINDYIDQEARKLEAAVNILKEGVDLLSGCPDADMVCDFIGRAAPLTGDTDA